MKRADLDLNAMVNLPALKSDVLSRFRYCVQSPLAPQVLGVLDAGGVAANDPGSVVWAMFKIAIYAVMVKHGKPHHVEAVAGDVDGIPWIAMLLDTTPLAVLLGMTAEEWVPLADKYKPSSVDEMDADYREMTKH